MDDWFALRIQLWPSANTPEERLEMAAVLENEQQQVFVATLEGGSLIGFLEANIRPYADGCDTKNVGYIEGWFVAAAWRRHGIGAVLVQAAETWAKSKGCSEMASDCDLHNEVSLHAHTALGYEEVERLIHFRKPLI
jgi:aminoglycoside 6'-N-acetyltransferase I